jgi:hypothetical protein
MEDDKERMDWLHNNAMEIKFTATGCDIWWLISSGRVRRTKAESIRQAIDDAMAQL